MPGRCLTVPTVYSVMAGRGHNGTPRLGRDSRGRVHAGPGAGAARHLGPGRLRRCGLTVDVRHAEAAPDDEFGQLERGEERADHLGCLLEGGRVEDLAADVCVDPRQFDSRHELERGDGFGCGPGGNGEAELRVLLSGPDELVRVRLDARGDPHQDLRSLGSPGNGLQQAAQAGDLVERVDDDAADPCRSAVASSSVDLLLP